MLLTITNTSGASLAVPFPISKTLAAAASTTQGVSLRDLLFDPVKGDEAWRNLTGLKQAGKITFVLVNDPNDLSLDPLAQALFGANMRGGTAVAGGAGDVVVAFATPLPAATYQILLGNGTAALAVVKTATARTINGFTLAFGAAGSCDWLAVLIPT
jgi:hypothetical protein